MTTQFWITGTPGDWSTAADWASGVLPDSTNDVVINASTVTVDGTAVANSLTLNDSTLTDSGTLTIGTSLTLGLDAQLTLSGGTLTAASIVNEVSGTGEISGYGTLNSTLSNFIIVVQGGTLKFQGSLTGDQSYFQVEPGASLELISGNAPAINLEGNSITLKLDAPAEFTGSIGNLVLGDMIDLGGITTSSVLYSYNDYGGNAINGTITINETNGQQLIYSVNGTLAGDVLKFASDNNGGTLVYWTTASENWVTGVSGDWSTAADWLPFAVPQSTDDVLISNNNVIHSLVTVNGTAVAHSLALDNSMLTDSGTLAIGTSLAIYNGSHFTDSGTLTIGTSLSLDNSTFTDSGMLTIGTTLTLDYGAQLSGGALSIQSVTSDSGTFGSLAGYGTISGAVSGSVTITANGGTLKVQGSLVGDHGFFAIDQGATLELSNGTAQSVSFDSDSSVNGIYGNPATLKLDAPAAFTGSINGVVVGDMIDLAGITTSSATYNGTTLTINETNGQHLTYNISGPNVYNANGSSVGESIMVASDGNGGTLVFAANPPPPQATTIQQEIAGLYAAVYDRAADSLGMQYWVNAVAQQADALGITYSAAANTPISTNDAALLGQLFVSTQSAYFNQTYSNLTDANFVNALYFNIGGQNAEDPSAIAYWVNIIQTGEASGLSVQNARAAVVGQFVHDLIDVNLNQWTTILTPSELDTTILRQAVVDNKLAVSLAYVNDSTISGGSILNAHVVGDAAFQAEVTALNGVAINPVGASAEIIAINASVDFQNLADIKPVGILLATPPPLIIV